MNFIEAFNRTIYKSAMNRAQKVVTPVVPWFFRERGSILDVGCGLGHVGGLVQELSGREVIGIDIKKYPFRYRNLSLVLYEGSTFPFADKSIDTVMIFFVLHHLMQQKQILQEVKRIGRKDIIICEDLVVNRKQKFLERIKDCIANFCQPGLVLSHRLEKEWEELFIDLGLNEQRRIYFRSNFFVLRFQHVCWYFTL